ncbi:hypothetical protein SLA2020_288180 [Shorea laevis]
MAEMGQVEVMEARSVQVWRVLINWLSFFLQSLLQILRNTPLPQLLSYLGFATTSTNHHLPTFIPIPTVDLPLQDSSPLRLNFHDQIDNSAPPEKLTVVLDLDETLICAYESSVLPAAVRGNATEAGLKWFVSEFISPESEGKREMTVFERPGLQEFLKQIAEFADLVLFTAGQEGYAKPLVDRIDAENRISLRLYRPSTSSTVYREHVKDLTCLLKDLSRVVIVDNNPFSFLLQPLNGVPCSSFSATELNDNQLLEVILPLLKFLSLQKDVRPILYDRFHMPEWFQMHGIPAAGLTVT